MGEVLVAGETNGVPLTVADTSGTPTALAVGVMWNDAVTVEEAEVLASAAAVDGVTLDVLELVLVELGNGVALPVVAGVAVALAEDATLTVVVAVASAVVDGVMTAVWTGVASAVVAGVATMLGVGVVVLAAEGVVLRLGEQDGDNVALPVAVDWLVGARDALSDGVGPTLLEGD